MTDNGMLPCEQERQLEAEADAYQVQADALRGQDPRLSECVSELCAAVVLLTSVVAELNPGIDLRNVQKCCERARRAIV